MKGLMWAMPKTFWAGTAPVCEVHNILAFSPKPHFRNFRVFTILLQIVKFMFHKRTDQMYQFSILTWKSNSLALRNSV